MTLPGWIDVTVPIRPGMPIYPGDPPLRLDRVQQLANGDVCNLSSLSFGLHTGTHVDAPLHFIEGAPGVDGIPLAHLTGEIFLADLTRVEHDLGPADLGAAGLPHGCQRLFLKTRNSPLWDTNGFSEDFVGLTAAGAEWLVERRYELVGIDYLSIAPYQDPVPTHRALLAAGATVVEGLDLRAVAHGWHDYLCLPLLVVGADGAPARVLLRPRSV